MPDPMTPEREGRERPWPKSTPQNRRDVGCYVVERDPEDDEGGTCWCGATIVSGYGQCPQCRFWLDGEPDA